MLQRWAPKASVWKPNILCAPPQPSPHPSSALLPCAHPALCAPLPPPSPPILWATTASYPTLYTSSPSSVWCLLLRVVELRITGKLHFAAKIRARILRPKTCVLLSSAQGGRAAPILYVDAGPKGKQNSRRASGLQVQALIVPKKKRGAVEWIFETRSRI